MYSVVTRCQPLYPTVTRSQLVTRYHSLSPVISFITRRHYHCISFYMSSVHPKFQASILVNKKSFEKGGLRPPTKAVSQSIGELTHMHAYHFPPYMRTNFQRSILINKKVGPSAPRKGRFAALRGVNPHKCTLLYSILY